MHNIDLPFLIPDHNMNEVLDHYRRVDRYRQSPETKAIVDAKFQSVSSTFILKMIYKVLR